MSIFISHSSNDVEIVESFVDMILIEGLGIEKRQIFCTSIQDIGIKSGEDFRHKIKKELEKCEFVIQIISEEYRSSEVCLNEMGAAWVLEKKVIPFILPPVTFNNVGFIHMSTQLLRLNKVADILKFRTDFDQTLRRNSLRQDEFAHVAHRFVDQPYLRVFNQPKTIVKFTDKDFDYFRQFLNPEINHYNLLIKAQPNLADCKAVFSDKVFSDIYALYSILYRSSFLNNENWEDIYTKEEINYRKNEIHNKNATTQKEILIQKYFKPNQALYSIEFKHHKDKYGIVFTGWLKINGRWVFFPKPLRAIRTIEEVKNTKVLKKIFRMFRIFGLKKELKNADIDLEFFIAHLVTEMKK